jgi:hypothetical protein
MRRYVMKLRMIMLVFISIFVACGVANADFYESFDDAADYEEPSGSAPYSTRSSWVTFFPDSGLLQAPGGFGGGSYTPSHIDRSGYGKALRVVSTDSEVTACLFSMPIGSAGIRWKFDLWIGSDRQHTANALKFLHMGTVATHGIYLRGANAGDGDVRYTNLETGGIGDNPGTTPSDGLYLRINHNLSPYYKLISYTNFNTMREEWINLEIEVVCGNPAHVKIWVNGELDFYKTFAGENFFVGGGNPKFWYLTNYSDSAGGNVYLAVDEFYKYDSPKLPGSRGSPEQPEPPNNLRVIN